MLTRLVAGIDEVGRGCIAGPVVAAAVILDPEDPVFGLADSKMLGPQRRSVLFKQIQTKAIAWAIGRAEASEIDQINILQASLVAMGRAFSRLTTRPDWVHVDGLYYPSISCPGVAVVKGDSLLPEIAAASIVAKVYRDGEMAVLDALYPGYQFARHKGYPTQFHRDRLKSQGFCVLHRKSFRPVKNLLAHRRFKGLA